MFYVYKITRSDGMAYIGITLNLKKREREHLKTKRFAMGISSMEVLFETDCYDECGEMEEKFIQIHDTYRNGLNLTETGKGLLANSQGKYNTLGHKYSDESKQRMSEQRKGKLVGDRNGMFGKNHSDQAREGMSKNKKGKTWITDGIISRLVNPSDPIPDGWTSGKTQIIDKDAISIARSGTIFVTNGRECLTIQPSEFDEYQAKGYERGRIMRNIKLIKDGVKKKVSIFEYETHISNGWEREIARDRLSERDARREKLNSKRG